jgi:hypothetical protein
MRVYLPVCLLCCLRCIHSVFIASTRNFACMYLTDVSAFKSPRFLDTCGCVEANPNFKLLAKTVDNIPSTHELMTSLKYVYGRLSQNSIDCPASRVISSSKFNQGNSKVQSDIHTYISHRRSHVPCVCFYIKIAAISSYGRLWGGKLDVTQICQISIDYPAWRVISSIINQRQ